MTFSTERKVLGGEPLTVLELDLDFCKWRYAEPGCGVGIDNQILQSEALDVVATWPVVNASIVANQGVDGAGATTLDLINDTTSFTTHEVIQVLSSIITTFNTKYCVAFEVESNGIGFVKLELWNFTTTYYAYIDLTTGAVGTVSLTAGATITVNDLGGGLFRVIVENFDSGASGTIPRNMVLMPSTTNTFGGESYVGIVGNQGINAGRVQLNFGATLANYGLTTTAANVGDIPIGEFCYNTRNTCQAPDTYIAEVKTYRFGEARANLPVGVDIIPAISSAPRFAPTKITPDKGLGYRASVSVSLFDFPHHDRGADPYPKTRSYDVNQGTYFGKLLARNRYYEGRAMRVLTGYITEPFDWANFQSRNFILNSIDGPSNGRVVVTGKDVLELASDNKSQVPLSSDGTLSADLNSTATAFTIVLGDTVYTTGDTVRIGDEILGPVAVSGGSVTGATRQQWGTEQKTHKAGDTVQICKVLLDVNVVDWVDDLLNNYVSSFDAANWLPYDAGISGPGTGTPDEWDIEKSSWLSLHNLTSIISRPEGVNGILAEVASECLFVLFWDEINRKLKLKANAPEAGNAPLQLVNDVEHIVADSVDVKPQVKQRLSRVLVNYAKINYVKGNDPENFARTTAFADFEREGPDLYGSQSIREFYSRWFDATNDGQAVQLQGRLLSRYGDAPNLVKFELDAKDDETDVGDRIEITTSEIPGLSGAPEPHKVQIIKKTEIKQGHAFAYEGLTSDFSGVYGFISPDTTPDRLSASAEDKRKYGFICLDTGFFADGSPGYKII